MRSVELRRHSLRHRPEEHLSDEGRRLAAWVGARIGPIDTTVASPATRAVETAEGLGHAPDRLDPIWFDLSRAVEAELPWPTTFRAARDAVAREGSGARRKADELWRALAVELSRVPEGGTLLVVTHGGFSELVVAGSGLREVPEEARGPVRCLEGVRFEVEEGRAVAFGIERLPDGMTRV